MTIVEEIKERRRLARMRLGQEAPEILGLKSTPDVRVALVPLTESEYEQALMAAASMSAADNAYGIDVRDRSLQVNTLYFSLRDPSNVADKIFKNVDEMMDVLEVVDINFLSDMYQRLVDDSSPALDGLTDEELDTLKKALQTIDWSVLSGKPWWHLKSFLLTLMPEQLQVNSSGLSLTKSLIGMSEESEPIPTVDPS